MQIGYARVSTEEQHLGMQLDALTAAGRERVFEDEIGGTRTRRPGLDDALSHVREGDALVAWKLDRLGRGVKGLIDPVAEPEQRQAHFRSLTDGIDPTTPAGRFFSDGHGEPDADGARTDRREGKCRAHRRRKARPGRWTRTTHDGQQDRARPTASRRRGRAEGGGKGSRRVPADALPTVAGLCAFIGKQRVVELRTMSSVALRFGQLNCV